LKQWISDEANYPRTGGARPEWRIDGAGGSEGKTLRNSCRDALVSPSEAGITTSGQRCWDRLCQTEAFSPPDWQTLRLQGEDSSISARMAWISSLAEITGNSRTRAQPRTQRKTSGGTDELLIRLQELDEKTRCRHSRKAGANRDSQHRLRKSSIAKRLDTSAGSHDPGPVQLFQDNQHSIGTASDLRTGLRLKVRKR